MTRRRPWLRVIRTAYVLAAAGGLACGSERAPAPELAAAHDSAGVTVVENRWDAERLAAGWALAPEPDLVIGRLEGEDAYELFQVGGGTRLKDGRVALLDGGSKTVRVFGADGVFQHAFGGEGNGPGEFLSPTLAGRRGDTLVVYDFRQRRASLLHVDEGFARSFPVGAEGGGFPVPQGLFADGSLTFGGGMSFSSEEGFPTGVIRTPSSYRSVRPDGGGGTEFGEFPGGEMFARVSESGFQARGLPFGRFTSAATGDSTFYLGTADAYEIRAYDEGGRLRRLIRLDAPARPVTEALRKAYVEDALEQAEDEGERINLRQLFREMPFPETLPPYGAMAVDALGDLWVADYPAPGDETVGWTVFDAGGRAVGRLSLPARARVLEIGRDYVLLRTTDELDVEQVRLLGLTRPSALRSGGAGS